MSLRSWYAGLAARYDDTVNVQKRFPGYFSKWVFQLAAVAVVVLFFFAAAASGWDWNGGAYACCNTAMPCFNRLYREDCAVMGSACSLEVLEPGVCVGDVPPQIVKDLPALALATLVTAFALNHFVWIVRAKKW